MKALIVGKYNYFTTSIASKLVKNGVKVAVFNANSVKEKFDFKYSKYTADPKYISEVYDGFRPDVVFFTAAFDRENYLDALQETLSAGASYGLERFIFLSSTIVYGSQGSDDLLPGEDAVVAPVSDRGFMFASGEDMCSRWNSLPGLKITILRMSLAYGSYAEDSIINDMLSSLLAGEKVYLDENDVYAALNTDDMLEGIMLLLEAGYASIYNLVSSEIIPAREFAELLIQASGAPPGRVVIESGSAAECHAADNSMFLSDYQWHERHSLKDEMSLLVEEARKKPKAKKTADVEKDPVKKAENKSQIRGFIETVLIFIPVVLLTQLQMTTDLISEIDFIILYLVLIAITTHLQQSALALLLSFGLLVVQQMYNGYDLFSAILNNDTLLRTAEYCIVCLSVNYVIQRIKTQLEFAQLEMNETKKEMQVVEKFSEEYLSSLHFFEDQILEYDISLPRIIDMTSRLDALEPERLLPETIEILAESIGEKDVAVYMIGKKGGRMRLSYAHGNMGAMGQSPLMDDYQEMLDTLDSDQIYVNRSLNPALPSMAAGVKVAGSLALVFVVWNMPFQKMRLNTSNLLKTITRLVSAALERAYRYEEKTRDEKFYANSNVMLPDVFRNMYDTLKQSEEVNCGILCKVRSQRDVALGQAQQIEPLIRENDYIGLDYDGNILILLSGTGKEGYGMFEKRIIEKGLNSELVENLA